MECKEVGLGGTIEEAVRPLLDSSEILEQVWRWGFPLDSYGLVYLTEMFEMF